MKILKTLAVAGCALAFASAGCAKKPPKELGEAQNALNAAQKNCAVEYASADYQKAKGLLDQANAAEKNRDARARAKEAISAAQAAEQAAVARKESAKREAEDAVAKAEAALEAARKEGAQEYAAAQYNAAAAKLDAAKAEMKKSDCNYLKARDLANEAASLAAAAADAARRAKEDEARRKAEEAARLAELAKKGRSEWTVKRGDSLWKISANKDVYGDPFLWPLIFKENRAKIKNPDLIYPKQVFKIKQDASDSDKKAATKHSRNRRWPDVTPGYDDAFAGR
jgi:nucleoid-associated protein YgaU